MRDASGDNKTNLRASAFALLIALAVAGYLTYLAIDFIHGGCDCRGGSEVTVAGIARAAILIGGAAILYLLAIVVGVRAAVQAMKARS